MKGKLTLSRDDVLRMVENWVRTTELIIHITDIQPTYYGASLDVEFTDEPETEMEAQDAE